MVASTQAYLLAKFFVAAGLGAVRAAGCVSGALPSLKAVVLKIYLLFPEKSPVMHKPKQIEKHRS